jgi:uncharacterized Zn finger protein
MSKEINERPISFYEAIRRSLDQIECSKGCESKKIVVNLKENGQEIFVFCNQCGTIIYDSKREIEKIYAQIQCNNTSNI